MPRGVALPLMDVVTGGAGFIGSNLVAALAASGREVAVCDWLGRDERWRNLAKHELAALIPPEHLSAWLGRHHAQIDTVIHLGAISSTAETDVDLLAERNIRATLELLDWCTEASVPLIYASSAATYGDGAAGFEDGGAREALARLRPLNAYGWSKHVVDRRIARLIEEQRALPPPVGRTQVLQCLWTKRVSQGTDAQRGGAELHAGSQR